jgi:hypothetical protein
MARCIRALRQRGHHRLVAGIVEGGGTAGKPEGIAIEAVSSAVFVAVPKLPARRVACRGPRAKYRVTVSVKPSP